MEANEKVKSTMKTSAYAIWSVRWKGVVVVCNNKGSMTDNMELYDLDEDPFEIQDIGIIPRTS